MHAQIQIFFVREGRGGGGGGGGGVQAQRRENSLDFFMYVLGFFSPKIFRECGEGSNYLRGGGVQMLISIEFDRTCDLPGMGSGPPTPPPLPLDLHMHDI